MTESQQRHVSRPVTFESVYKRFSNDFVVNDLNLTVENGEMMVLLGPSGCGKTTSLRMLAGLESITSGSIRIGGVVVNDLPPRSRNIAMVFQSYALYSHLKVYDNLAYPLRVRKLSRSEVDRRVRSVADLVQIGDLLDRKPREISGGQRQRVALGRSIIREPAVFLMDEPLSNLDAKLRLYMRGELKRFQRELETTTIYVTHDQAEAMTLADRVAIMDGGILQQVGAPRQVYHDPVNVFVAGFLGSPPMNFLTLELVERDGYMTAAAGSVSVAVSAEAAQALSAAGRTSVIVGIRPEHVVVTRTPGDNSVAASVVLAEDLGNEVLLDTRVDGHPFVARMAATGTHQPDEVVWLELPTAFLHYFDSETELRIGRSNQPT